MRRRPRACARPRRCRGRWRATTARTRRAVDGCRDRACGGRTARSARDPRPSRRRSLGCRRSRLPTRSAPCEQRVRVAVVAALELEDEIAAAHAACETHGAHHRLRPRGDEPDHLDARDQADDPLGELDLERGRHAERRSSDSGLGGRADDLLARVAEEERAPGLHVVDVLVPIGVDDVRALAAHGEARSSAHRSERANRGVDPARDHAASTLEELGGSISRTSHRGRGGGPIPPGRCAIRPAGASARDVLEIRPFGPADPRRHSALAEPVGGVLRVVGQHEVGAGAADRGEELEHDLPLI